MLYLQVDEDNKLTSNCKNCNFKVVEENMTEESACVAIKNFAGDANSFKNYMTPFIKFDPSLPRVNNIKCPSETCKVAENEVIYMKYDQENLKFIYFCCHCEHFWKN
jgi:hypothetical protein